MCRLIRLLYVLVPLGWLRSRLLRHHLESCPNCRQHYGLEEDVWPLPSWILNDESLRLGVLQKLEGNITNVVIIKPEINSATWWRWALVPVLAAFFILGIRFLKFESMPVSPQVETLTVQPSQPDINLISARVSGQPVQPYIVKSSRSPMVVIWLEKEKHREV